MEFWTDVTECDCAPAGWTFEKMVRVIIGTVRVKCHCRYYYFQFARSNRRRRNSLGVASTKGALEQREATGVCVYGGFSVRVERALGILLSTSNNKQHQLAE